MEHPALDALPEEIASAERLPTLPAVAVRVLRLASDENASIEEIVRTIARDPALSAKLLKVANSSLFRRGAEITTLDKAAMLLGLKTVKLMALSFSLAARLPRQGASAFDYRSYWHRSLVMTVAARSLARLVHSRHEDEAFLCGLLSRIGQLVLAESLSERYGEVLARSGDGEPTAALEREVLGYDHHEIGALLLRGWELPTLLWEPIRHYGRPESVPAAASAAVREVTRLMHLSALTSELILAPQKGAALEALHRSAQQFFGLCPSEMDAFVVGLRGGITETALLLNVTLPDVDDHREILDEARRQMVQIGLGTAFDLHETYRRAQELERQNRELASRANTDALTGLPNRAHFDAYFQEVVAARAQAPDGKPLGILVLDVDHFKQVNDKHGHLVGDRVLRDVATAIASSVRGGNFAARYGGEEFVVVLPNVQLEQLLAIAERLRMRVGDLQLDLDGVPERVTVSVGGACVDRIASPASGPALLALADDCMYEAKRSGRDCSVCRQLESR